MSNTKLDCYENAIFNIRMAEKGIETALKWVRKAGPLDESQEGLVAHNSIIDTLVKMKSEISSGENTCTENIKNSLSHKLHKK